MATTAAHNSKHFSMPRHVYTIFLNPFIMTSERRRVPVYEYDHTRHWMFVLFPLSANGSADSRKTLVGRRDLENIFPRTHDSLTNSVGPSPSDARRLFVPDLAAHALRKLSPSLEMNERAFNISRALTDAIATDAGGRLQRLRARPDGER